MDTKLKNKNRWGTLIGILIVVSAAAGLLAFFPWLRAQAFADAVPMSGAMSNDWIYEGYYTAVGDKNYIFSEYWKIKYLVCWIGLGIGCLVIALSVIIGCLRCFGMTDKIFFKAPFEVVSVIGIGGMILLLGATEMFSELAWQTVIGELQSAVQDEFMIDAAASEALVMAFNYLCWLSVFFLLYWSVTCFSAIFTIGPVRYLKERTLTGRFLRWCKRLFVQTYDLVESIDFREKPNKSILKIVGINFILLALIASFWFVGIFGLIVYSIVLFFLLRKNYYGMQEKYQVLLKATNELAQGNLDVAIDEALGVFEPLRGEIEKIQHGFKKAVEEELKSQSMKTELVTNVSHDLKTPLTAIITYVNLLKKPDLTEEERQSYVRVLDQKSMRLKGLIEDLFEISRANSQNVTLNLMDVDIVSLMKQVRLELDDKIRDSGVDFRFSLPDEKLVLNLDSEKTYRVFENLLVNITKYAMPGTRAYVDMEQTDTEVRVSLKNISATELSIDTAQITERFVRGDSSRNTEGSGLGLAIAKSFVELQKGTFEVEIEADLFKVRISWPREAKSETVDEARKSAVEFGLDGGEGKTL